MASSKIDTFGGMIPAVDDRLLPDRAAAHAENTWLYSGRLSGIPELSLVKALTAGTSKVFRIPTNYIDSAHIEDSTWIEFADPNTDVIRAPVIGDTFERYYWASSTVVPKYNTLARIQASSAAWKLGIPAPVLTSVTPDASGVGDTVSRAYLITWVSAYGEEGPASNAITATGKVDDSWDLVLGAVAAGDDGGVGDDRYLTHVNIYRTITASDGTTTYFFVAQQAIADTTYSDTATDTDIAGNNELESTNWIGPPTDLQGFVSMPNGIIVGWRENELWFSEPYRPHAWPAAYAIVVDYPIVGLGVTNQTLVVCTQAYPYTAFGIHPASMALSKSASLEPCLERKSIAANEEGVYYASPNGLVMASQGVIRNITKQLITRDKWSTLTTTSSLHGATINGDYYGFGGTQAGVFDEDSFDILSFTQEDFAGAYVGVLIDPHDTRLGFTLLSDPVPVTNVQNDQWSGELFVIKDDNLYRLDLSQTAPIRRVYIWRSKIFQTMPPTNLGAMKIYWSAPVAAPSDPGDAPGSISFAEFPELPDGSTYGVVRLYVDDTLVWTRNLATSGEAHETADRLQVDDVADRG